MIDERDASAYAERVWPAYLDSLAKLLAIESVSDVSQQKSGAPFGEGCRAALDFVLGLSRSLGLSVSESDGYMGYAEVPGSSGEQLGLVAHLDVVPSGPGWTCPPFGLTRRDGVLVGRGVCDDKGAALAALYAAAFFAGQGNLGEEGSGTGGRFCATAATGDESQTVRHAIRCIFGCSEETGMADIRHYLSEHRAPDFALVPDASFPVCCGEKGCVNAVVRFPVDRTTDRRIVSFEGGTVRNAVPAHAEACVRAAIGDCPLAKSVDVQPVGEDLVRIEARGRGGHAAEPVGTINAIAMLAGYLVDHGLCSQAERSSLVALHSLLDPADGSGLGIATDDELFGPLTCVGGVIETRADAWCQTLDIRVPHAISIGEVVSALQRTVEAQGLEVDVVHTREPYYADPDSACVHAVLDAYRCCSGEAMAEPYAMGGGTYAHHLPHAVAAGPLGADPRLPAWVGSEHMADEGILESQLKIALATYVLAISRLQELPSLRAC